MRAYANTVATQQALLEALANGDPCGSTVAAVCKVVDRHENTVRRQLQALEAQDKVTYDRGFWSIKTKG